MTEKQQKKKTHFPLRKYAVKVCGFYFLGGFDGSKVGLENGKVVDMREEIP